MGRTLSMSRDSHIFANFTKTSCEQCCYWMNGRVLVIVEANQIAKDDVFQIDVFLNMSGNWNFNTPFRHKKDLSDAVFAHTYEFAVGWTRSDNYFLKTRIIPSILELLAEHNK